MTVTTLSNEQHYATRLKSREDSNYCDIWDLLDQVKDPEIPVLSLWDLGVLVNVEQQASEVVVTITPTYSGCSAMDVMKDDIVSALADKGYTKVSVKTQLAPAWSSLWMSPNGRERLNEYGIAPPNPEYCAQKSSVGQVVRLSLACPNCHSLNTRQVSEFGSTACKALHQCNDCLEPFDYFKTI